MKLLLAAHSSEPFRMQLVGSEVVIEKLPVI